MITADLIDRLVEATNEAKETVRELHAARRDARQAIKDLDAKVATVRAEVIEGQNELVRREWDRAMDSTNLKALGAGLKSSFDQWADRLEEAAETLESLHAKDAELAEALVRIKARVWSVL